jgi:thymidylate kinase
MLLIVEGIDRVGKDTLIGHWHRYCESIGFDAPITKHFVAPPVGLSHLDTVEWQRQEFLSAAREIQHLSPTQHVIWNRSHLGEWVYGYLYRLSYGNIGLNWLWDVDKQIVSVLKSRQIGLLLMLTDPEHAIARDDSQSFSVNIDKKWIEIHRFIEAYQTTQIESKSILWQPKNFMSIESELAIVKSLF